MSFSIFNRTPQWPDSRADTIELIAILSAIAFVTYLISTIWISASLTSIGVAGYLFDAHLYITLAILIAVSLTLVRRIWQLDVSGSLSGEFGASVRDLALIGGGFLLYEFGRTQTRGSAETAIDNAHRVIQLQDWLHLPDEARFQRWVMQYHRIMDIFNTTYSFMFLSTFIGVFLWMSFNAPAVYRTMRNAVGAATFTALLFFAFVPLAPPRLTEASGMVDSYARVGLVHGFVNQYAAMPSLHVGWMALAGWGLAKALGGWKGRVIGLIPPTVMMVTVVVTGNHYWLDGIVGSILCLTPAIVFDRLRNEPVSTRRIPSILEPAPKLAPRATTYITVPAISGGDHSESREVVGQQSTR